MVREKENKTSLVDFGIGANRGRDRDRDRDRDRERDRAFEGNPFEADVSLDSSEGSVFNF